MRGREGLLAYLGQLEAVSAGPKDSRGDTGGRIFDAAIEQFAHEGAWATSVRKLSAAVGISAAGIYSRFDSKAVMLGADLARTYAAFLRHVFVVTGTTATMDFIPPEIAERHMRFRIEQHLNQSRAPSC